MESFEKAGIKDFTENFGTMIFKMSKIEHHKNGRISKIYFESQDQN